MGEWTTLSVPVALRDRLKANKQGGETYAELLNRLLEQDDSSAADAQGR